MILFEAMVWIGSAMALGGFACLLWCIRAAARAKAAKLDDEELRATIRRLLPVNLAALLLSAFGLGLVAAGALLG